MIFWTGFCVFDTLRSGLPQQVYMRAPHWECVLPDDPSTNKPQPLYMNLGSLYLCVYIACFALGFYCFWNLSVLSKRLASLLFTYPCSGQKKCAWLGGRNCSRSIVFFALAPQNNLPSTSINCCLTCFNGMDMFCLVYVLLGMCLTVLRSSFWVSLCAVVFLRSLVLFSRSSQSTAVCFMGPLHNVMGSTTDPDCFTVYFRTGMNLSSVLSPVTFVFVRLHLV